MRNMYSVDCMDGVCVCVCVEDIVRIVAVICLVSRVKRSGARFRNLPANC